MRREDQMRTKIKPVTSNDTNSWNKLLYMAQEHSNVQQLEET